MTAVEPIALGNHTADKRFSWIYGAYLLDCTPYTASDGQFTPRLRVSILGHTHGSGITVILPDCEPCRREAAAAQFALEQGMSWVDSLL